MSFRRSVFHILFWFERIWRFTMGTLMLVIAAGLFHLIVFQSSPRAFAQSFFLIYLIGSVGFLTGTAGVGAWLVCSIVPRWEKVAHIAAVAGFGSVSALFFGIGVMGDAVPRFIETAPNVIVFPILGVVIFSLFFRRVREAMDVGVLRPPE